MRSDLEKLPGVADIKTDIENTTATFKLAMNDQNKDMDLKAKLDEFAKTNEHMKDWSFLEGQN